jgi:hypothetical protein
MHSLPHCIKSRHWWRSEPALVAQYNRHWWPGLLIRIYFIRIRIQHFRLNTDPDLIRIRIQSGSRALMTKN